MFKLFMFSMRGQYVGPLQAITLGVSRSGGEMVLPKIRVSKISTEL